MTYKQNLSMPIKVIIAFFTLTYLTNANADSSKRSYECDYYAREAVEQHRKNLQFNCGFKGTRWNNNRIGQKNWCVTVRKNITDKENNIRKQMLENCFKTKTALNNPENHPKIPSSCKDHKKNYTAIKSIYSWYRYDKEVRTPVENGLIQADFNRDGRLDYVFIEQNKKQKIRLIACISDKNFKSYQRKTTSIVFDAKGDSLMSEGYHISMSGKQLHLSLTYFGHNEGSSSADGFYIYNNRKHVFELKDSTSSAMGIPMNSGYNYPIYVPVPPRKL